MDYKTVRLAIVKALYRFPPTRAWALKRLPMHRAGYKAYWVEKGPQYRSSTLREDHERYAAKEFPTTTEMLQALADAHTVLEVGCGYGFNLERLNDYYDIEGFDVSPELVESIKPPLKATVADIADLDDTAKQYDVVFCRLVMTYFMQKPELMKTVMQNMERLSKGKVVVWEWRHVCDYMREVYPSARFEYHNVPVV